MTFHTPFPESELKTSYYYGDIIVVILNFPPIIYIFKNLYLSAWSTDKHHNSSSSIGKTSLKIQKVHENEADS